MSGIDNLIFVKHSVVEQAPLANIKLSMPDTGDDTGEAAPLQRDFYDRPTLRVARDLLGCMLVRRSQQGVAAGIVVETEAYCGVRDRACHAFGGRRTPRNEIMFGPPGFAYVYFTYGMHHCFNIVTRGQGHPEAVLVRSVLPVSGLPLMRQRRSAANGIADVRLARGPGNLCRALGIDRSLNGADLTDSPLIILPGKPIPPAEVRRLPRIGIAYAGEYTDKPWRFLVRDHPAVSGPRVLRVKAGSDR